MDGAHLRFEADPFGNQALRSISRLGALEMAAFAEVPIEQADETGPFWANAWFPTTDAIALCSFLSTERPGRYVEIGAGNSTKFARWWINRTGLPTRIVSIDPAPRAEVDDLCDQSIRSTLQDADLDALALGPGDMVFMDSSHIAGPGSDVAKFFDDIVPALPPGAIYGLHDIFLPADYPAEWIDRGYDEQDVLAAHITEGAAVEMAVNWLCQHRRAEVLHIHASLIARGVWPGGGAMFLRRQP